MVGRRLGRFGFEEYLAEIVDLFAVEHLHPFKLALKLVELPWLGFLADDRLFVIRFESVLNVLSVIDEIQNKRVFLAGASAVETRQCLHGLDAIQPLIDVHGV